MAPGSSSFNLRLHESFVRTAETGVNKLQGLRSGMITSGRGGRLRT